MNDERDYFLENLSLLIGSGTNLLSALASLEDQLRMRRLRRAITRLKDDVESGSAFWKALSKEKLFPEGVVSLIRIGEETGKLAENLQLVADHQEKDRVFRGKIRSAMIYPVLVLTLTLVIGVGIAWFILPRLAQVFSQLDLDLPLPTQILIAVGTFLRDHGAVVIPLILTGLAGLIYVIFFFGPTKLAGELLLLRLPVVHQLFQQVELARFGYILGTLLDAGIPVIPALTSLQDATPLKSYQRLYWHLQKSVTEGASFQKSFLSYPKVKRLIPVTVQQMVVAAEQSGTLAKTLHRIGQIYDDKTEETTKNLATLLEPILLFIVWAGVLGVAVAIILPIYNLIGGLNQ